MVSRAHIPQKWIVLHPIKTKMTIGPFNTYCWVHFTSESASFCDNL